MKKNKVGQSVFILVLTLFFLFAFSFLPEFSIFSLKVKQINLLEDIALVKKDTVATLDSLLVLQDTLIKAEEKPVIVYRKGTKEVEDFGTQNLKPFFESLNESKSKPVRIAFFGDSFIEGDILVSPFRDSLQAMFGGRGVGYMPITSEVNMFRTSIQHLYFNWETYSLNGNKNNLYPLGFAGYCFLPKEGNEVVYLPGNNKKILPAAKLFYKSTNRFSVAVAVNDEPKQNYTLPPSDSLRQFEIPKSNFAQIRIAIDSFQRTSLYGAAIEDSIGISVDNFSMRSNPGLALNLISDQMFVEFNKLRNYQLIILQYGLNVVNEGSNYFGYEEKMVALINRLKILMPNASFLLLGVSDRCSKQGTEMKTMPGVFALRDAQRRIAYKSNIAFWDLFEGMGGENSMVKYTEANPPLGAKDYTHLTFKGGRKIAKRFVDALLRQKKKYEGS